MSRSEKISQILARRNDLRRVLEGMDSALAAVGGALAQLDAARVDLSAGLDDQARGALYDIGTAIRELEQALNHERGEIGRTAARFARPTLTIGMVGRARMGKSRFLQSLTGLTSQEIPDGDGGFCTGVASLIRESPDGETRAEVYLHDESSFLGDVIAPYYESLGLGPVPGSLRTFAERPLPPPADNRPRSQSVYQHLVAYHENFAEYGAMLNQSSPITIGREKIRQYVAQESADKRERYHVFRAVRRVVIETPFNASDVRGLGVVDLPGLGDTNLGDSRILLAALQDEVDVVLFMREPAPRGDDIQEFDIDLYSMAREALPELPMDRRSFLFLNHRVSVDQDNLANARRLQARLPSTPIRVVDSTIVDCSNPAEVARAIDPVVDHLVLQADDLDGLLVEHRRAGGEALCRQLAALLADAGRVAAKVIPDREWFPVFQDLFDGAYRQMSRGLHQFVKELAAERDKKSNALAAAVNVVIGKASEDRGLPGPEEVLDRIAQEGGHDLAYQQFLNEARAHLSRHFLDLDVPLKEQVEWMQHQIARCLTEDGVLGRLCSPGAGGQDALLELAARTPDGRGEEIRYSLTMLSEFELSYRSFIQHRIRPCLNRLQADSPLYDLGPEAETVGPAEMIELLRVTHVDAVSRCEESLRRILTEPNAALFAIAEEFRDRVLRTIGARNEWRTYYQQVWAEIWPEHFRELVERSGRFTTWNTSLDRLRAFLADIETGTRPVREADDENGGPTSGPSDEEPVEVSA